MKRAHIDEKVIKERFQTYEDEGDADRALQLLNELEAQGFIPTLYMLNSALQACAKQCYLREASVVFDRAQHEWKLALDAVSFSAVISCCLNCGRWGEACKFGDLMATKQCTPPSHLLHLFVARALSLSSKDEVQAVFSKWGWELPQHGLFHDDNDQ